VEVYFAEVVENGGATIITYAIEMSFEGGAFSQVATPT